MPDQNERPTGAHEQSSDERRFLLRVTPTPSGCWEWDGGRYPTGYGRFRFRGSAGYAHRAAWTMFVGEIPSGLFVCHHCDNPPCCNPAHLFLGTPMENTQDAIRKGRWQPRPAAPPYVRPPGPRRYTNDAQRADILARVCRGETQVSVARDYSLHITTIYKIVRAARDSRGAGHA